MRFCFQFGGNTTMYPASFTRAEKLETQNGIRYNRNTCQPSSVVVPREEARMPIHKAVPIIALNPVDVNHNRGRASKWVATVTAYQMA